MDAPPGYNPDGCTPTWESMHLPWNYVHPEVCTTLWKYTSTWMHPQKTDAQQAGGMHPTGMYTCILVLEEFNLYILQSCFPRNEDFSHFGQKF